MAKIFYSMAGEGRGHATRVAAIVERLRRRHEIHLFAPHHAYELLAPLYAGSNVTVEEIPGLTFHYDGSGHLSKARTGVHAARYVAALPGLVRRLARTIREHQPQLAITDFEPALPRAAERCGLPYISVDHQHFLVVSDLSDLPAPLRRHARFMSWIVRCYYRRQRAAIVSSFYFPPLKESWRHAHQVGVLLRPEVLRAEPRNDGYLCVYLRRRVDPRVLEAIARCGRRAIVYGLGELQGKGRLAFRRVDPDTFVTDLAHSDALVSTAGNQLVGEALYLGKPVFAMPEAGNMEQAINGFFLQRSGAGRCCPVEDVDARQLGRFLADLDGYRSAIDSDRVDGTEQTLRIIESQLALDAEPTQHRTPVQAKAAS